MGSLTVGAFTSGASSSSQLIRAAGLRACGPRALALAQPRMRAGDGPEVDGAGPSAEADGLGGAPDASDFDYDTRMREVEGQMTPYQRASASLAEVGLSVPGLALLVAALVLVALNSALGPGWLGALLGG